MTDRPWMSKMNGERWQRHGVYPHFSERLDEAKGGADYSAPPRQQTK
jgi:hypothetical protein